MAKTIVLDTHNLIKNLKAKGFTEQQATGITEAIQEIDLWQLGTKADLREMELRLVNTFTNRMIVVVSIGFSLS